MNDILNHIALIVCLVGLVIWMICIRLATPPAGVGEVGRIMFAAGLLAVLLGR